MAQNSKTKSRAKPITIIKSQLGKAELDEAYDQLFLAFDHENAGFGSAPKFPSPHNLLFLMRYYNRTNQQAAWSMVERTLRGMRLGGIFDQVGLGFHRYSTDARWFVPHFEKMLYDQALLALAYVEAFQASGAMKFKVTAKETLDYVLRDLTSTEGGFYSAEDADSEGEEGKFYLWTQDEIKQILPSELADFAIRIFGVLPMGNYNEQGKGRSGKNILHIAVPLEQMASESNLTVNQVINKLGETVNRLFQAREKRVHPFKDDKVLVDWNGLTIAALSRASIMLDDQKYLQAAKKAADFILSEMRTETGGLYHRFANGEKSVSGFLDDYAFLVFGLVELYEAGFDEKYLQAGVSLTKMMIAEFWDSENGGFYFTGIGGDEAVPRIKQTYDGAVPSGNAVALYDLLRLARLSGEMSFEQYASKMLQTFAEEVKGYPMGHTFMLVGLDFALGPAVNVVLSGELTAKDTQVMVAALRKIYIPNLTVKLWIPKNVKTMQPVADYEQIDGKATAYVCRDQTCMPPTNDIKKMLEYIELPKAEGDSNME